MTRLEDVRIAVIGLGYVGLPLAAYLAQRFPVVGFDANPTRITELKRGHDRTGELTDEEFKAAAQLSFAAEPAEMSDVNVFIVTVPTPIDHARRPDLSALMSASRTVGKVIRKGGIVIYESTVYPGATEEDCVPIVAKESGLTFNTDFFAGYSPERINPGDPLRRLPSIKKVTAGSTPEAADLIDQIYASVITAGTHKASSIRVAEAAKVIENVQRDVNIALVNELAMLFKTLGLDTIEVLEAAGTKWNFHPYRPGLVGGHCIGVDPYYLTHKAQSVGFHPEMILAGRRINDGMALFVTNDIVRQMVRRQIRIDTARVLIAGFTFKENCPDLRNTKVADLVRELSTFVGEVVVYDPLADCDEARHEYDLELVNKIPDGAFNVIALVVPHTEILGLGAEGFKSHLRDGGMLYDVKAMLPSADVDARL